MAHRSSGGSSPPATRAYVFRQHQRLTLAAELCYKISLDPPLPEELSSLDGFRLDWVARGLRGESRIDIEKHYLSLLHEMFASAFRWLAQRVQTAVPLYQTSLEFLNGIGGVHRYPVPDNIAESLRDLSNRMRSLRQGIDLISWTDILGSAWTSQFDGCRAALKRCEFLFKTVSRAIGEAEAERRLAAQDKLAREANDIAKGANDLSNEANSLSKTAIGTAKEANGIAVSANVLSRKANTLADEANVLSNDANKLASEANRTATESKTIAERADKTGKTTMRWTAVAAVAAFAALGWDGVKWGLEKSHEQGKETATSAPARHDSNPGTPVPKPADLPSGKVDPGPPAQTLQPSSSPGTHTEGAPPEVFPPKSKHKSVPPRPE